MSEIEAEPNVVNDTCTLVVSLMVVSQSSKRVYKFRTFLRTSIGQVAYQSGVWQKSGPSTRSILYAVFRAQFDVNVYDRKVTTDITWPT